MTNIILCGGSGTRLWPISRTLMPKQFVKLFNNKSLFQLTLERNSKVCDNNFIVSNTEQYFLALDQLEELDCRASLAMTDHHCYNVFSSGEEQNNISYHCEQTNNSRHSENQTNNSRHCEEQRDAAISKNRYLLEPIGRNTAPAIALACMALNEDEIVLVTPSDHLIKNEVEYSRVLLKAKELAEQDNLVTFGITPTFPETGFGYIEAINEFDVKAFHEKPDLQTATLYLKAGNYYWNSGMFMFKAGVFLDELKKYSPKIFETCKVAFENKKIENQTLRIQHSHMETIPSDSIDYAVMEKSSKVKVVPSSIGWSDVGSFDALAEELPNDENNNFIISDRRVETIDIHDCIIIDSGDALLISKKGSSQKVKDIVARLKKEKSELSNIHLTGHRPWGTYTILEDSNGYKIKRIEVKPGKRLSLQKHFHRNEHWIVVSGCATVTVEDKTFILNPNESTYIKAGQLHRLQNEGKLPLVIIEAQVGEYTGEDDIVRVDDDFSRN